MKTSAALSGKVSLAAEHNSLSTLLTVPPTDDSYMIQLTLEKLMVERMHVWADQVEYQNQERCQLTQSHALEVKIWTKWIPGKTTEHLGPLTNLVEVRTTRVEVEKMQRPCPEATTPYNSDLILNNQYGHYHVDHN